jgi:hypothetical protein
MRKYGWLLLAATPAAQAQVPDLLNALDAGGRSMGVGSGTAATDANTFSALNNPAGLAYLTGPQFTLSFRNIPASGNVLSGDLEDPTYQTDRQAGPRRFSHAGYALPMGRGVLGISYTVGGAIRDTRTGDGLRSGTNNVREYLETLNAQTDFFTVSWGQRAGSSNWGVGLVLANQYVNNDQFYRLFDASNSLVGIVDVRNSGHSYGIGAVAGVVLNPDDSGRTNIGVSLRTPIKLSGNDRTKPYIDQVPGKASLGFATRTDPRAGNEDFITYGAQVDWYFGGDKDGILQREDAFAAGGGVEYNLHRWGARWPIRIGYQAVQAGGDSFINRNALTFGVGYRPTNNNFSVDLSFASAGGGPLDTGLSVTYRFAK